MAWLLCDGQPVASLEEVKRASAAAVRSLGTDGVGALRVTAPVPLHTFRMPAAIDLAICDAGFVVRSVRTVRPNRIAALLPRPHRSVIVAAEGSFQRWDLAAGSRLEVRR